VDVRVIAATNKDLEAEIEKGLPRGSLLPPERHPDPRAAAARSPRGHSGAGPALRRSLQPREQPPAAALHAAALEFMQKARWKGNVRELQNTVERLLIMTPGDAIDVDDLRDVVRARRKAAVPAEPPAATTASPRHAARVQGVGASGKFLVEKLRENAWNISKTAEVIGTPRSNLYKKLRAVRDLTQESDG
jgi:two-component system nitrogen regulation response regulator NtrX